MQRSQTEERMESPETAPRDVRRSLQAMTVVNLKVGGLRSLLAHLVPLADGLESLSLLDVGTGSAELPSAISRKMARQGTRVSWIGVDRHAVVLRQAQALAAPAEQPPPLVRADAGSLPFPDRSVDIVMASLFLHHLSDREAVITLSEMARVARLAVLVSDLERHPLHYLGARVLAATLWRRDPITKHDGPISVLRSFTADELREAGTLAGFSRVRVRRHLPFRLVLEGRP